MIGHGRLHPDGRFETLTNKGTSQARYRAGVDVGGTFTDVVLPDADGSLHALKLLSSPGDYGLAIVAGMRALLETAGVEPAAVDEVVHGTTVATNAVLEGTSAPTGLLTTRGFRDVLEIRRIRIPVQYDFTWKKPRPLVARARRLEVDERINARGEVERPLDPVQVRRTVEQLLERGAEAIAVCLLNSYANPVHERAIGALAKSTLIEGGGLRYTSGYEVGAGMSASSWSTRGGGYALRLPVVDVAEVGAGGGSVVTVDAVGRVSVGPRSAGAVPGPACYARGGDEPTVTDANVVLGYLSPGGLLGGEMPIDTERATRAIREHVATPLGCSVEQAAWGIHMVANSTMARAVRAISTQRGRDVREFTLIAFGGSGPVHAAQLARTMGIGRVVVPLVPGLFSAAGLLMTDIEHDFAQTYHAAWADVDGATLQAVYRGLEAQAEATLLHEGLGASEVRWRRSVDLRYRGQSHALTVALEGDGCEPLSDAVPAFEREHERTYGHRPRGAPVELANVRLRATVPRPRPALRATARTHTPGETRTARQRERAERSTSRNGMR